MKKHVLKSLLFVAVLALLAACEKQNPAGEATGATEMAVTAEPDTPWLNLNRDYYPRGEEKIVRGNKYGVYIEEPRGAVVHVDRLILASTSPYLSLYEDDDVWILEVDINLPANTTAVIRAEGYWIPQGGSESDFDFDGSFNVYTSH